MSAFRRKTFLLGLLLALTVGSLTAAAQSDEQPIARAILFYSPTCPHCIEVL